MAQDAPPVGPRRCGANGYVLRPENEGEFSNLDAGDLDMNETSVPKLALVPSKIAADALEGGYMPWEVHDALVDFEDGKGDDVKRLLKPCKNWALAAALRGDQGAKTSKLVYVLTPIAGAPAQLMRDMKARLNGTLGMHIQKKTEEDHRPSQNRT